VETPAGGKADLAVPCHPLAKTLKKPPKVIAEEAAAALPALEHASRAWAENGYLNFEADPVKLARATLEEITRSGSAYGKGDRKGSRVLLEHTSVNPTGPIHVGRARNPIIGDTLARAMRARGDYVTTEYYVNDVGKQVVILAWGLEHLTEEDVEPADRDKADHKLVHYYQRANALMESDPKVAEEIGGMLRRFEDGDEEVIGRVRATAERMLGGILESLELLNVRMDSFTWESMFIADGSAREVVETLQRSEHAKSEAGASYLDLEPFGVHGRDTRFFFTRSDGTTLYTTRDLAYHVWKLQRADRLVNVLGEDQKLGQAQLAIALKLLGQQRAPETLFYSFVSLPQGRMSTRAGVVVYLDDLIEEAEARALEEVRKRRADLTEERMASIARDIGRGAVRYNILRVQPEKQLVFKWEDALNFDGNSAPFVQYAHARACSILRKAGASAADGDPELLTNPYETALIKTLARYPSVLQEAGDGRVHVLPAYAHELAGAFNQFYAYVPVLKAEAEQGARLRLVDATRAVLKSSLEVMGLGAPEEM